MIYTVDHILDFGKYKGEPLINIIEENPNYVKWCFENVSWFDLDAETLDLLCTWKESEEITCHIDNQSNLRSYDDNYKVITPQNTPPWITPSQILEKVMHRHGVDDLSGEPFFGAEEVFGRFGLDGGWGNGI